MPVPLIGLAQWIEAHTSIKLRYDVLDVARQIKTLGLDDYWNISDDSDLLREAVKLAERALGGEKITITRELRMKSPAYRNTQRLLARYR